MDTFADECRHRFNVACQSAVMSPFHVDKRRYWAEAWRAVDDYLDWLEVQAL